MRGQPPETLDRARAAFAEIKRSRIEDYLHIGGHHMSAREAAERVGVSPRTINRYRRELRQRGGANA